MVNQFAAHLTNTDTNDEYMIAANTPEEAEAMGARQVTSAAEKGVALEMIIGPLGSASSFPTGQIVRMNRV